MLAKLQMEAVAICVTCATIGEAEAMATAGIRDILIANQLVTIDKLETTLSRLFSDQAALFGMLNKIQTLNLTMISLYRSSPQE